MARLTVRHALCASTVFVALALAPASAAFAQQGNDCGTPAVPAVPADPGEPGGGATPAQPAQPAQPAKCPDDGAVQGASTAGSGASVRGTQVQAGPDGILGTADDIRPSAANTGFGGTAPDPARSASLLLGAAGLALAASLGARRLARVRR